MPYLVVIYGPSLSGKSSVAHALAASLPEKTALVGVDDLLKKSIVVPDRDAAAEIEMVHTQTRLLVANYLKHGYNVVVEGSFLYERDGVLLSHENEIGQLTALMRNLARAPLLVRLDAPKPTLTKRAAAEGRTNESAVFSGRSFYEPHVNARRMTLDTDGISAADAASQIRLHLDT